jgi:hypothetical protein
MIHHELALEGIYMCDSRRGTTLLQDKLIRGVQNTCKPHDLRTPWFSHGGLA